jgi:hypothetical protein
MSEKLLENVYAWFGMKFLYFLECFVPEEIFKRFSLLLNEFLTFL